MGNLDLKECRECKKQVSQFAKTCPNCGIANPAKPASFFERAKRDREKNKNWINILAVILVAVIMVKCYSDEPSKTHSDETTKPKTEKTAEQLETEVIERQFSPWDGSHRNLYRYLKENVKDPDSLEHIETRYKKNFDKNEKFNNTLSVTTKYRAKNSFGGYVVEFISADYDLDGNLIRIKSVE